VYALVLCACIDLAPALDSQGFATIDLIEQIERSCNRVGGSSGIPKEARQKLQAIAKILNIGWIADGAAKEASIICPRSSSCPRDRHCLGRAASRQRPMIETMREKLVAESAST
jgi:hypothetical protein